MTRTGRPAKDLIDGKQRCTECGEWKAATTEHFHKSSRARTCLVAKCKICRRLDTRRYYESNRERETERSRRNFASNPDYIHRYYRAHRAEILEYKKAHPERYHKYYITHRERVLERARRYRKENLESVRAKEHRRRARLIAAPGRHTGGDIRAQMKRQKGRCYYCSKEVGDSYTVEHVIPLSRGGTNDPSNLVIACASCNFSKQNKLPHEWPKGGRLL
jgi:5-methylcytosine-specific restriction endonuclease McrA